MVLEKQTERFMAPSVRSRQTGNALACLTCTSFLIQFFNRVIGSYAPYRLFILLALAIMFGLVLSTGYVRVPVTAELPLLWIPMLIMVTLHVAAGGLSISHLMDLLTYMTGVLFVFSAGSDSAIFRKAFRIILFFSLLYAVSVWIQVLLPGVYRLYLNLLPADTVLNIMKYRSESGQLTGFSTNPGFTAGHIVAGIIAFFSLAESERRRPVLRWCMFLFLLSALLLNGKRAHLMIVVFACLLIYMLYHAGEKRFIALNILILGAGIMIPVLFFFSDSLSSVPALGRISQMLVGLVHGEDVSNGRSKLYAYALYQFFEHPVFGMGWGRFRTSIIGTVTLQTELDTHNIYLQLLCETGITGFLTVIVPMASFLIRSISNLLEAGRKKETLLTTRLFALYAAGYQLFFVLYGFTGNPLYDYNYAIMYFVSCAMTAAISAEMRKVTI